MTDQELEMKLGALISCERKITNEILVLINLAEDRRLYLERGFGSLFDWLVQHYKYSEAAAYRRISAARMLRAVPEVEAMLAQGSLNMSNLVKAQVSMRRHKKMTGEKADARTVVQALENKSKREAEETLSRLFPDEAPEVQVKHLGNGMVQMTLQVPVETFERLSEVRDELSHKKPDANLADVICHLAAPVLTRRFATAAKRRVVEKAKHCDYVDPVTGRRCTSRYQLEVDHIIPKALGGTDDPENLRCLCRKHNLLEAEHKLGFRYHSVGK